MILRILILIVAILAVSQANSQEYDSTYVQAVKEKLTEQYNDFELDSMINTALDALSIFNQNQELYKSTIADMYNDIGIAYHYKGKYELSNIQFKKGYSLLSGLGEKLTTQVKMLRNIGIGYEEKGAYERAKQYYLDALEKNSLVENEFEKNRYYFFLYRSLAGLAITSYDFHTSENYSIKALKYATKMGENNKIELPLALDIVAIVKERLGKNRESLEYGMMALKEMNENDSFNNRIARSVYENIALCHMNDGNYAAALINHMKTQEVLRDIYGHEFSGFSLTSFSNTAKTLEALGRYDEALEYHVKSMSYDFTHYEPRTINYANSYINFANHNIKKQEFELAHTYLDSCLELFSKINKDESTYILGYTKLSAQFHKANCFHLQFLNTKEEQYLYKAVDLNSRSVALIDTLVLQVEDWKSSSEIIDYGYLVLEQFLQLSHESNSLGLKVELDKIYQVFDKSKSISLVTQLRIDKSINDISENAGLKNERDKLQEQTNSLYSEIAQLGTDDKTAIATLQDSVFTFQEDVKKIEAQMLGSSYQDEIFQILSNDSNMPRLQKDEALIEYFYGNKNIYRLIYSADLQEFEMLDTSVISTLNPVASNYKVLSDIEFDSYFSNLIIPIQKLKDFKKTKLVIIPDGTLSFLPFETLRTGTNDKDDYILNEFDISYCPSYSMIQLDRNSDFKPKNAFAGFAPDYKSDNNADDLRLISELIRSGEYELPGAAEEVSKVASIFQGAAFIGDIVSKKLIDDKAHDYNILHLAMHGIADVHNPLLSGLMIPAVDTISDYLFAIPDILNLNLSAELVNLSACETGIGDYRKGEGVHSIGRAFILAGAKSVIQSLWKVPDESTSYIMTHFYKYLKNGDAKDRALRLAKLDYINDESIPSELKTPRYWAGFIISGDTSPLQFSSSISRRILDIMAALIAIIALLYFTMKKNPKD